MKKYIILIAAATLSLTACEGVLNKIPQSEFGQDAYFRTAEDLQLFSNTFYNNLLDKTPYSSQSDVFINSNLDNRIRGGSNRNGPESGVSWNTSAWNDIRKINTLLGNIYRCEDEDARIQYTALARFFRAYVYADKVRRFGDIPWVDVELGSADEKLYAARDSREFVMGKMIEDIDYAIENLPETKYAYSARVNKYAALALKAQFCLFEGTFRKYHASDVYAESFKDAEHDYTYYLDLAAEAADELIKSGKYRIWNNGKPNEDYWNLFASSDAITDEYILSIHMDAALGVKHDATAYGMSNNTGPGMTKKMVDSYLMADGTRFTDKPGWELLEFADEVAGRDPRLAQTIRTPGYVWKGDKSGKKRGPEFGNTITGYQPIKFAMPSGYNAEFSESSYNDIPVFRYAEVLLNYAEAKAELGTLTQVDLDKSINLIRDRVAMPHLQLEAANASPDPYLSSETYGYVNVTGPNKGVILEIRRERAVELFMEGEGRYFDLMRWKEGNCFNQPLLGMYIPGPGEYDFDGDGTKNYYFYVGNKPSTSLKAYKVGPADASDIDIYLSGSEEGKGCIDALHTIPHQFNEERDYLYPVPAKERSLNHNLTQNPGWDDGLDF